MFRNNVLIIFVKYPEPGKVKTRLSSHIGDKDAAVLYRLFVERILEETSLAIGNKQYERIIFYTPAVREKDFKTWLGDEIVTFPQEGNHLGERLTNAFRRVFSKGARNVIVIGSDTPHLPQKIIIKAFGFLENADCVIGPTYDGGYYLLGTASYYEEIFEGIDWGTEKVYKQTLGIFDRLRFKYKLLRKYLDVDTFNDLFLLQQGISELNNQRSLTHSMLIKKVNELIFQEKVD